MRIRLGGIVALGALLALTSAGFAVAPAQEAQERVEDYPDLPGRDDTFAYCTGCHGFKVVAAQGMTREQWDATITWMTERHAMGELEGEPRQLVLDYLTQAFAPRRAPGGWQNPFAN
jgi:hypothetical protein